MSRPTVNTSKAPGLSQEKATKPDLPQPAWPATRRGPSGSHSYFGLRELCRTRADPADLWMCGQDRSQCPAGAVRVRGICDAM